MRERKRSIHARAQAVDSCASASGRFMCDRKRSIHVRPQAVDSSKRDLQSSLDENAERFAGLPERRFRIVSGLPTTRKFSDRTCVYGGEAVQKQDPLAGEGVQRGVFLGVPFAAPGAKGGAQSARGRPPPPSRGGG